MLLYLPKDIVAGDFYWAELLLDPAALFVAVADCTGHGVPGAMVSVVCSNALNRAVNEYGMTEPGVLLDKARELILDTYAKSEEEVKDGMDISLLRLDPEWKELQWSGAHNPLWIVRNGTLIELPADRQPVGLADHAQPFTTHRFALQKDDCLYLLSDGFADQFGGEKNKKFKSANLKKLLEQVATLPMNEQRDAIHRAFLEWKGENEQVDDITILGIRV